MTSSQVSSPDKVVHRKCLVCTKVAHKAVGEGNCRKSVPVMSSQLWNEMNMRMVSFSGNGHGFRCIVLIKTGSLSAPDVNSADDNQPWKKACCGIPTRVHPHLPGLTLNQYTTWSAAQKARTSSRGHHRGLQRYTVRRMANAYLLHTVRCQGW